MYIIPTRGRPEQLTRFISLASPHLPYLVIMDEDDAHHYAGVRFPKKWASRIWPRARVGDHYRRAFAEFPSCRWYGMTADDIVPNEGWDERLAARVTPTGIIWPRDGINDACTHPVIGGEIARSAGFIAAPGLMHFYLDNVWLEAAKALGIKGLQADININHHHFTNGKAAFDSTYAERPPVAADKATFEAFMAADFQPLIKRLKCLI